MNEQLKKYIDPVKNLWGKMTKRAKAIFFTCVGGVVLLAIVLGLLMNRTQYSVLYAGMDSDEAQQVTTELQKLDVPYKSSDGTIYVAKNDENSVRMQLSNEGYPKTVPNYDFFTSNVGVMTTDDERKIIEQYQLQDRLQAVIRTLSPVDTDYVTISIPEGSTYAWDDNKQSAAASVTVRLKNGESLSSQQVNGIKQLVSKSVPNLTADNVSVVNSETGTELASSSSDSDSTSSLQITLSEFKLKIEKEYENNVEGKILSLLEQAYGKGNISVSVKSKMDLDKKIQDIVTYTPSTSDGKGVVSQSQEEYDTTQQGTSSGSVVGAQANADTTTTYPGVSVNGNVITTKDSKTFSYLVSQVEEQIQSDAAALDDLTVAVVVNTDSMSAAQKQEVTTLVANAAAVDPSKVAVMAAPLNANSAASATSPTAALPQLLLGNPLVLAAGAAALVLLILLIVLLAARRRRKRAELMANLQPIAPMPMPVPIPPEEPVPEESAEEGAAEEEGTAAEREETEEGETPEVQDEMKEKEEISEEPKESIEEIRNAMNGKSNELKNDLKEFASRNPEIAAQLIRSWLRGEDKHG